MSRKSNSQVEAEKEIAKFDVNYAKSHSVAKRALEYVSPMITAARGARKSKESEWLEDLRLWACQIPDGSMYLGRSNLFIPELHNQVETSVGQFQSGLFPNDNYINCIPNKISDADDCKDIGAAVFHELDHKNNLPDKSERFQRQKVLFGTAFYKTVYEKEMKQIVVKEKGYPELKEVPKFEGVRVHVMDTFHTYIWPETCQDVESSTIMFDECFKEKRDLELQDKIYANLNDVTDISSDFSDYGWVDTVRMTISNLASASAYRKTGILVTECWCDFDIVQGKFQPCVITLGNLNTVLRVQRNPFYQQTKPYSMGRYMKAPGGEAYGHSLPERLRSLQYMMNDLGNQTMDSLTFALNPICLIDPGFAGDVNSFKLQPGAKWLASPQGVSFQNFTDVSGPGFQGMQQLRGMIQQFSDNSPNIAPQLSGKVRSASQSLAVQGQITANTKNMISSDEYEVYGPLCEKTFWLLYQFQSKEYQIATQGADKGSWITKKIDPKIFQNDVMFFWKGSEVAEKTAVRSQQLMNGYNLALQTNAQMPGLIDLPELFKAVMYEAFDLKDLNIFIPDRDKKTVDPELENMELDVWEDVNTNPGDVYQLHMDAHRRGYEKADSQEAKLAYIKHMEKHDLQKQARDMLREQQARISALKTASAQGGEGEAPSQGQAGNPYNQQNPSSTSEVLQGMRATEPNMPQG